MAIETVTYTGAPGQAVTTGNSGFDILATTGGQLTFDNTWAPRGANVAIRAEGTTASGALYGTKSVTPTSVIAFDVPVTPKVLPSYGELVFMFFGSGTGSTRCFALATTSTGILRVRDSANALAWASDAGALVADSPCVLSVYATQAPSAGSFRIVVYEEDGTTVRVDSGSQTGQATGAGQIVSFRTVGAKASTSTVASSWLYGEPRWDTSAGDVLPPWSAPVAESPFRRWDGAEYVSLSAFRWSGSMYTPVVVP